jgi:hypothetical protein
MNMPDSILLDARYADITATSPLTETSVVYEPAFDSLISLEIMN